jgi:lysylphosphatidylglycerol synthetase-like protein (DUF2156 family)
VGESQGAQPPGDNKKPNDAVLSDEAASKMVTVMSEFLTPLTSLRENVEKTYSASIAYMDRVIILAGGTLTLTFTALATISSHLEEAGRSAVHPAYVTTECWLLVLVIAFGLLYNRLAIGARQKSDQAIVVAQMVLFGKMKLMSQYPGIDVSKFPDLGAKNDPSKKGLKRLTVLATVSSVIVHVCLSGAFICLAYFIQDNIGVILTAAPHAVHK